MKIIINYNGVEIKQNEKFGSYYLNSPVNGTQRIFDDLELAKHYINHCEVIDSHARALAANCWT